MTTFEIVGKLGEKQLLHLRVVSAQQVERLDSETVNVTVEDEIADELTDWLEDQEEVRYRLV
jgi:hypothetical protein